MKASATSRVNQAITTLSAIREQVREHSRADAQILADAQTILLKELERRKNLTRKILAKP